MEEEDEREEKVVDEPEDESVRGEPPVPFCSGPGGPDFSAVVGGCC